MPQYKVNVEVLKSLMYGDCSTLKDVKWSIENNQLTLVNTETSFTCSEVNYTNISKKITNKYKTTHPYRNVQYEFFMNGNSEISKPEIEDIIKWFSVSINDTGFERGQRYSIVITDVANNTVVLHENTIQFRYQVDVDINTTIFIDETKEFIYDNASKYGSTKFYDFVDKSIDERLVPYSFRKVENIYLKKYIDGYISNKKTNKVTGEKYRTMKFNYTFLTRHILSEKEMDLIMSFWKENSLKCSVGIELVTREKCEDD
ncbi:hypothetical protein [Sulfurimonas xiamenensis]|uniref:Uncharacterized protein n=1 Tax=Sulfurimonas xiamenensis TaxID=2590021 RepID=A0AAJ4A2W6_9BACT|nr:hypothetical protein [Sulfurimonas xiamenensis]QFR42885.1 hypothetical protein FJR47_02750 [Sulfurimonas xiamenensis]